MAAHLSKIFSDKYLSELNQLPEVLSAKERLSSSLNTVYFSIPVTEAIKTSLREHLGLDLSNTNEIPMRWIQGDTVPHVDKGVKPFEKTHLVYLTDSAGQFILDSVSYPIVANSAFVFNEGLEHSTTNTGSEPRLILGPMSERANPVGAGLPIIYYPSEADALAYTNSIGSSLSYIVGDPTPGPSVPYTHWRIASNSTGTSATNVIYPNGSVLNGDGNYYMYPANPCFLKGTKILTLVDDVEVYRPIEDLKKGDLVKTFKSGYKKVEVLGSSELENPWHDERIENRLYVCTPANYSELTEDLYITGCHSILVTKLTDVEREALNKKGGAFVTEGRYRLMACVDERAVPWASKGLYTVMHLALENADEKMNYGIYVNGGLLVETSSINFLKNRSNILCNDV